MSGKISIIGGGGLVGSCTGFALQAGGIGSQLALLDVNRDLAEGQVLDLLHGSPLLAAQRVTVGDQTDIPNSDIVCITAGLRRKPDESRLDLVNRNLNLFRSILSDVQQAGLKSDAIVVVVSNPVDILTRLAQQQLGLPPQQVIGLGTWLDTIRFRSLIARELAVPATQVSAVILGEHGDTMVPIWSTATVAGLELEKHPAFTSPALANQGAEVIAKKGGAGFAVGAAIADLIKSILHDERRILPISTRQQGAYGIRDVALSVPTVVGRAGASQQLQIELWPKEQTALLQSAQALSDFWKKVVS